MNLGTMKLRKCCPKTICFTTKSEMKVQHIKFDQTYNKDQKPPNSRKK